MRVEGLGLRRRIGDYHERRDLKPTRDTTNHKATKGAHVERAPMLHSASTLIAALRTKVTETGADDENRKPITRRQILKSAGVRA
jgi:hypothetical protein